MGDPSSDGGPWGCRFGLARADTVSGFVRGGVGVVSVGAGFRVFLFFLCGGRVVVSHGRRARGRSVVVDPVVVDTAGGVGWRVVRVVSAWLALVALLAVVQSVWRLWGSGLDSSTVSRRLETASVKHWESSDPDKVVGLTSQGVPPSERWGASRNELIGYLRVPAFGASYRLPIIEGTDEEQLDLMGAGHYPSSAWAGERGNASFAGHATYSDMAGIGDLRSGDQVIVEGFSHWWVYEVNRDPYVVDMHRTDVVGASAAGAEYGLTLTTCWPVLSRTPATHRTIVHASLVGWADKSAGVPEQLASRNESSGDRVVRAVSDVSERVDMPVTGVLAVCLFVVWLLLDLIAWLVSHRTMLRVEWRRGLVLDPLGWLWRLTAGVWPSNRIVFLLSRGVLYAVVLAGVVFACFRWVCPVVDPLLPDSGSSPVV